MRDLLIMSAKERERKVVMEAVRQGQFNLIEASRRLEVSYRQTKRLWCRYQALGDKGLLHGSRGKKSSHAFDEEFKEAVLWSYREKYDEFGPTFACEKLAEEGFKLSNETLRLWLRSSGMNYPRRKRRNYRRCRERREAFGELLQIDGSIHRWLGAEGKHDCLLNMVDDATGTTLAVLAEGETTQVLLSSLMLWIKSYGIPKGVYVDLKSVYISPKADGFSVFQEVCAHLGIEVNRAYSAQAKGRVERKHAVYQDRFVKELALRNIKEREAANAYLLREFIPFINKKFALSREGRPDVHRPARSYGDLNQVICWRFERQVRNDWTIQWRNRHYQLLKENQNQVRPKQQVELRLHLNGKVSLWRLGKRISYKTIEAPVKLKEAWVKQRSISSVKLSLAGRKGKANSPWKQFNPGWLKGHREEEVSSSR